VKQMVDMTRRTITSTAPILSIVIVDSDSMEYTLQCVGSIYRYPLNEPFEIIVVDNCSYISCLPVIQERYPQVRTYTAPQRQGFSKNYNLGIHHSVGEYVLVLNNDTILHPNALNHLISAARKNPIYGMLGAKLFSANGKIQTVCVRKLQTPLSYLWINLFLDAGLPLGKLKDRYDRLKLEYRSSGPVPCISGACMLLPRAVLEKIGMLDEAYDFYYEDIEWCHRVHVHGMEVAYIAEAEITHYGDQSLSRAKVWAKQSEYRSALRYFRQYHHLSTQQAWMIWIATVLSFFLRGCVFLYKDLLTHKVNYSRSYFYLFSWALSNIPE
jgi:GT2 family glycosyltransferase